MPDRRRLFRAQHQDISIQTNLGSGKYIVRGTRDITYKIDLQKPSCTCPDWEKREPTDGCKHILAVKIKEGKIESLPSAKTSDGSQSASSSRNIPNWNRLARQTKKRDNWTCQYCGKQGGQLGSAELHAHHIKPRSKGGEDTLNNLITVCHSCHEDLHDQRIHSGGHPNSTPANTRAGRQTSKPTTNGDDFQSGTEEHDHDIDTQNSGSPDKVRCKSCWSPITDLSSNTDVCDNCLTKRAPKSQADKSPNRLSRSESKSQKDLPTQTDQSPEEETKISYNLISFLFLYTSGVSALFGWMSFSDSDFSFSIGIFLVSVYTLPVGLQALVKQEVLTRYKHLPTKYRKKSVVVTCLGVFMASPTGVGLISLISGDSEIYSLGGVVAMFSIGMLLLITRQILIFSKS